MEFLNSLVLIVNVISALTVIILVLMQHGKGADMGAAFGSGSAGSLFGSAGSANFLSRSTAVAATVFFATSLALVLLLTPANHKGDLGVMSGAAGAAKTASGVASQPVNKPFDPSTAP
jgi:preprotein translocase subunit SecG